MEEQKQENLDQKQEEQKQEETKTYTQAELDKIMQSETDRKVSKALETSKAKWEEEYTQKLESQKTEAEKLAKMSEQEKYQAQLQAKEKELAEREQKILNLQLEHETVKQLAELNIPTKFSNFLIKDTADNTKENITAFTEMWQSELKAQIEKQVEESLKGTTPTKGATVKTTMTKLEFGLLPAAEKIKLQAEQPEMVKQILAQ